MVIVDAVFLAFAEVLFPDRIKLCVNDDTVSIIILPYFLNSGRHVVEDIPDADILIAPIFGASHLMMNIIISSADTAK